MEQCKVFRQVSKGAIHGFKTTFGYLFISANGYSLEIHRDIKKSFVFKGNLVISG